jgi:hypothetical protein
VSDHRLGGGANLGRRAGEPHPALAVRVILETPRTAAARVDLRLYHIDRARKFAGRGFCFIRGPGDVTLQNCDAVSLQQFLGLILVDVHDATLSR